MRNLLFFFSFVWSFRARLVTYNKSSFEINNSFEIKQRKNKEIISACFESRIATSHSSNRFHHFQYLPNKLNDAWTDNKNTFNDVLLFAIAVVHLVFEVTFLRQNPKMLEIDNVNDLSDVCRPMHQIIFDAISRAHFRNEIDYLFVYVIYD